MDQKRFSQLYTSQQVATAIIAVAVGKLLEIIGYTLSVSRDIDTDDVEFALSQAGGVIVARHRGLAPGGSCTEGVAAGILFRGATNADLLLSTDPPNATGSFRVSVSYREVDP